MGYGRGTGAAPEAPRKRRKTMQFSREFFTQRSFEVVWAVFRVGEFVKRKELRELLEQRALGYMSRKSAEALDELDETVKLGMQIGEIKDVNGRVLLRETGNLRAALAERARLEEVQKNLAEGSIEEIFKGKELGTREQGSVASDQVIVPEAQLRKESGNNPAMETSKLNGSGNSPAKEDKKPALFEGGDSYRRKQVILGILQSRNMCGIRDIAAALPNTSERTLRYDVKQLVERKLVERVGRGGPDSFLRLKVK